MKSFYMNGIWWDIAIVPPNSEMLEDRTGAHTVATTDPTTYTIYLSSQLQGPFLAKVLLHELGHCIMVSYNLLGQIHDTVYPDKWIEAEEWLCNFISDYGFKIFGSMYDVLGDRVWDYIPRELEKLVS